MFSLKDPSLLQFDKRRVEQPSNLKTIYKLTTIPCDTQMRTILDPVPPDELRPSHNTVFNALQRGNALEKMRYLVDGYLMPMDGTGTFSSEMLFSDHVSRRRPPGARLPITSRRSVQPSFIRSARKSFPSFRRSSPRRTERPQTTMSSTPAGGFSRNSKRSAPISRSSSPMTPSVPTAPTSALLRAWAAISFSASRRATMFISSLSSIKLAKEATAMS